MSDSIYHSLILGMLVGQRPTVGGSIPTAFMYDDGSMVFQSHANPDASKQVLHSFTGWNMSIYSGAYSPPWNSTDNLECIYPRITSAIINDDVSVKSTNHWFHYHSDLTDVYIGRRIKTLGTGMFYGCRKLQSLTIPDSVTFIGSQAFYNSGLVNIVIPNSVTSIAKQAFSGCADLISIALPNSIRSIPYGTFSSDSMLSTITIPASVTSIGAYAFSLCDSLTSVVFEDTGGWWVSTDSEATSGTSVNVSDPATAAAYLTSTYKTYYWFKD